MPGQRESQKVRFAHVDRAGIVFYPRYIEMLAGAFPGFAEEAVGRSVELVFRAPARLGERLEFRIRDGTDDAAPGIDAFHDERLIFECRLCGLTRPPGRLSETGVFRQEREIAGWMVGPDRRLHLSRYYEFLSDMVEDWFADRVGVPFATMFATGGVSTPTVRLASEIRQLPAVGERVTMILDTARIGTSSITLDVRLYRGDRELLRTEQVLVTALRDPMRAVPIPEDIAAGIRMSAQGSGDDLQERGARS
ncbi:MAG: hypothetical protein R3E77_14910 [Steroidobacteraceae bacterium]